MIGATTPVAMITAPGSGQGKSMVTVALACRHRNARRTVRVFKHGPGYLDPVVLSTMVFPRSQQWSVGSTGISRQQ